MKLFPRTTALLFSLLYSTFIYAQSSALPELTALASDGSATATRFRIGLSNDGGLSYRSAVDTAAQVAIDGSINPAAADLGATADLFVVARLNAAFYMKTAVGSFVPWNGRIADLVPFRSGATLETALAVDIFDGHLAIAGSYDVFLGYRRQGADALVYTGSPARFTSSVALASPFYTPAPIASLLDAMRPVTWAPLGQPADLKRFAFGPAGSSDVLVLSDGIASVAASLSLASGLASQSSASNDLLLRAMFEFLSAPGGYRIVATKHSNYALDVGADGSSLVLRDIRSGSRELANTAYLVFTVDVGSNSAVLRAVDRMVLNAQTLQYTADANWSSRAVVLSGGTLALGSGADTPLALYAPPLDFDIPADFNPAGTSRVANAEVPPFVKDIDDKVGNTPNQVGAEYRAQLAAAGPDAATRGAATTMLQQIATTLAAEGAALRYPQDFYLAFRDGLLARVILSSDSTDGVIGQRAVPYVYFTNEADTGGTHHPFMVIASYGLPDSLALLWDVPKPPGGDCGDSSCDPQNYATQPVTRSYHREAFLMKIPLRDYGEVASLTENTMVASLATDVGITAFDHHSYASVSATGIAIDGVIIYPSYNNTLHVSQSAAELSAHGMHSGRGLGVHYHADSFSAAGPALNLYNEQDYEGRTHPPLVSIGFDGVAGYGVYKIGATTSEGATLALDAFGGHEHGVYGYHYHSFTQEELIEDRPGQPVVLYTAHMLPPYGAWAGRINTIPEFWQGPAPNYVGGRSRYLGTE